MRVILLVTLLLAQPLFAEEKAPDKKGTEAVPTSALTVKEAKKICKEAGKEGVERLKCIKEKTGAEVSD